MTAWEIPLNTSATGISSATWSMAGMETSEAGDDAPPRWRTMVRSTKPARSISASSDMASTMGAITSSHGKPESETVAERRAAPQPGTSILLRTARFQLRQTGQHILQGRQVDLADQGHADTQQFTFLDLEASLQASLLDLAQNFILGFRHGEAVTHQFRLACFFFGDGRRLGDRLGDYLGGRLGSRFHRSFRGGLGGSCFYGRFCNHLGRWLCRHFSDRFGSSLDHRLRYRLGSWFGKRLGRDLGNGFHWRLGSRFHDSLGNGGFGNRLGGRLGSVDRRTGWEDRDGGRRRSGRRSRCRLGGGFFHWYSFSHGFSNLKNINNIYCFLKICLRNMNCYTNRYGLRAGADGEIHAHFIPKLLLLLDPE